MNEKVPRRMPKRYDVLDGLRGVAAIGVMIYHYTMHSTFPLFANASLAVDFFFMLSGFVIAHSYGERLTTDIGITEYLGKRLIRLFPMYFAGLVIGAPLLYLTTKAGLAHFTKPDMIGGIISNSIFLPFFNKIEIHNIIGNGETIGSIFPANPPSWSLFFELFASLAFILLTKLNYRNLLQTLSLSFAGLILCGVTLAVIHARIECDMDLGWGSVNFLGGFPRVLFGFTFGLLIYAVANDRAYASLREQASRHFRNSYWLYLALIIVLAVPKPMRGFYPILILITAAPAIVFAGGCLHCTTSSEQKIARFLGWLSYPTYCLHYPIFWGITILAKDTGAPEGSTILFSVIATLSLSVPLTKLYEEPVRKILSTKFHNMINARKRPAKANN